MSLSRCSWAQGSEIECQYHDQEWGVPLRDEDRLFEFLLLEGAQAGLSWVTILKKREAYRIAFDQFNAEKIAAYDDDKIEALMQNKAIIRNRLKINAAVTNARCFLKIQQEGSFSDYLWQFVQNQPVVNIWHQHSDIPAKTPVSEAMSQELKQAGFKFVGPTICYAFMQAVGMVNDHTQSCFRQQQIREMADE